MKSKKKLKKYWMIMINEEEERKLKVEVENWNRKTKVWKSLKTTKAESIPHFLIEWSLKKRIVKKKFQNIKFEKSQSQKS